MQRKRQLALVASVFALSVVAPASELNDADARQMKRFIDAINIVTENAADPVDADQAFYQGAIPGLLHRLDPHSVFFDPGQFEQLQQMETSTQKGFGTVVSILPGRVVILQVLSGTPSESAGLSPGDEILAVNNYALDRLEFDQIVQLLGESRQKPAQLVVRRPGNMRLLELTLTPQEMKQSSVERAFELQPSIGYIRVTGFEGTTARDLRIAIEKLGGEKLKGLVLDLRNNPGGFVDAAIEICSDFLKPGQAIFSAKGRNVPENFQRVPPDTRPYDFPLAIIVNEKSASASEIVSGALQDHDRATIVGQPTFGKGLVQSVYPLSEKTGLALTTALYYIPSGRSIQKPFSEQRADSAGFELGNTAAHANEQTEFKTDSGRTVKGGGGIVPDIFESTTPLDPFRAVLEDSGSFTSFATEYLRSHKITEGWDLPAEALDLFQSWLVERRIQPSLHEWISNRDFITSRLKTELYNQGLGVEQGDRIAVSYDPQVQKALEAVLGK